MSHAFLFMRSYSIVEDHENTGKNIFVLDSKICLKEK